jgi:membrane-associated phospholipid phosphatase
MQEFKRYWGFVLGFILFVTFSLWTIITFKQGEEILRFNQLGTMEELTYWAWITKLGEWHSYVAVILFFLIVKQPKKSLLILASGIFTLLINTGLKNFFSEPRPAQYFSKMNLLSSLNIPEGMHLNSGFSSFPSGHTTGAYVLFVLMALSYPNRCWFQIIIMILAGIVGLSRMILAQHYIEDTLAGALLGLYIGLLCHKIWEVIYTK